MKHVTFCVVCMYLALLLGCGAGNPSLDSIQVDPHQAEATSPRGQQGFTATGIFSNNSTRMLGSGDNLDWTSSNDLIASIDTTSGQAICRAPGTVTITVTAPDDVTLNGSGGHSQRKVVATAMLVCL